MDETRTTCQTPGLALADCAKVDACKNLQLSFRERFNDRMQDMHCSHINLYKAYTEDTRLCARGW